MRRALVLAFVCGCGGGHSGGISLGDLPQAFVDAVCSYDAKCGLFPDVETCLGANTGLRVVVNPSDNAALDAGKLVYDSGKARECIDAIAHATCDHTDADLRNFFPQACNEIASGTVHAGGECAFDLECVSQSCDVPSCPAACCMGMCVGDTAPMLAQIGETCTSDFFTASCVEGAFCDSTNHCAALLAAGATCNSGRECDYGLGCAGSPQICKSLPLLGEPCPDFVCRDDGQICKGTCVKIGLPGDACTSESDCASAYTCDTTAGKCAEGPTLGQPCSFSNDCFDHSFCDIPNGQSSGTCAAPKPDGQPCTSGDQCENGTCNTQNICMTPPVCI